jgi:phosphatidylinositol glycan class O
VKNGGIVELIQHDVQGEQKSIQHVVLLLIDGLRLDFMSFHNESTIDSNPYDMCGPTPFNCWRYLHYLLTTQPQNTAFFSFRADPPTTTSQRLKGITTGTLPTFIDIGSNLNSDAVTDDNLIDQLRQHFIIRSNGDGNIAKDRRKMVVLGDDTWKSLYPHQFDDYKVYHSLNTKDIDGVDEQIFREIYHYFPSKSDDGDDRDFVMDWAVLVAHFLAIDHIGHTHSAFSPLMADHLSQFDQMLEKIVNQLPPNSLLLLFGDHGMTDEGEHGGSSEEELKSGLFLYSNVDLRGNWSDEATKHDLSNPPEMYQIDLIPAISSILQTPIPFSNVGKYVNSPFFSRLSGQGMLDILLQSSSQISKYFETYFHIPQSMFSTTVDHLDVCFDQSKTYEWSHQCLVDLQCHGLETSHHSAGNHRRNFCEALKFHMLCLVSQNFSTGESQPACSHAISTYQTVLSEIQDIVR